MKEYLFFGDSFTYGQDAEDDKSTWPYHYLTMIGKQDARYAIKAKPGQSNSGIFLDILDSYHTQELDKNTIVFVGLTNIYRDSTTIFDKFGYHKFMNHEYQSVNAHNESEDKILSTYRNSFIMEEDWMLCIKNLQYVYAIENLLNRIGCKFYLIDVILSYFQLSKTLDIDEVFYKNLITSPHHSKWDIYQYLEQELNAPLSHSKHFYSEGYHIMAKVIKDQIDEYEKS